MSSSMSNCHREGGINPYSVDELVATLWRGKKDVVTLSTQASSTTEL